MDFLHSFRFTVQYKHVATPGNQTVSLHIENISKHFIRLSLIRLPFIAVFLRHQHTKVKKRTVSSRNRPFTYHTIFLKIIR